MKQTRRKFLQIAAVGAAGSACAGAFKGAEPMQKRPNIIYIVAHDLGRFLESYGVPIQTPNLTAFAEGGVQFNQMFCNSPACSPSRGCAMTGKYAHNNGLMGIVQTGPAGWHLPASNTTMVDIFNQAGYETINIGGQHERLSTEAMGYDVVDDEFHHCEVVYEKAVQMLKQRQSSERPFYMNLYTGEVHGSQWVRNGVWTRSEIYQPGPPEEAVLPPQLPDLPEVRKELASFNAAVRYLDHHIGPLFKAIQDLGFEEDTIVIFTTDHGREGLRAKGFLYDAGTEISFMIRAPQLAQTGIKVDHLMQNIDVLPTLCDAAGLPVPSDVQGRSFWPLLTGGLYHPHNHIFTERNYHGDEGPSKYTLNYDPARSVRTERYHYIRNFAERPNHIWLAAEIKETITTNPRHFHQLFPPFSEERAREELFDIVNDPDETRNLAALPEYQAVKKELSARVDQWMQATSDPVLTGGVPPDASPWPVPKDEWEFRHDKGVPEKKAE